VPFASDPSSACSRRHPGERSTLYREPHPAHDEALQLPHDELDDDVCRSTPLIPNTDGRRTTSAPPHPGQHTVARCVKTSFSNWRPHVVQRYS
jgi:hypothetical protein